MRLELSEVILGLRKEIQQAQKNARKENLKFTIECIEIEAQCTVSKEAGTDGKVKWNFFIFTEAELNASAKVARETVQTIKLKLVPKRPGGHMTEVNDLGEKPNR